MGKLVQLKLLIWKNILLRKRQKVRCFLEVFWPMCLFLLLCWVRSKGFQTKVHECHFEEKPLLSTGPVLFYQGLLCAYNNTCHRFSQETERNYSISSSHLYSLVESLQDFHLNHQNDYLDFVNSFINNVTRLASVLHSPIKTTESIEWKSKRSLNESGKLGTSLADSRLFDILGIQQMMQDNSEELEPLIQILEILQLNKTDTPDSLAKQTKTLNGIIQVVQSFLCGNNHTDLTIEKLKENIESSSIDSFLDDSWKTRLTYEHDPESSELCNNIYEMFETSKHFKLVWRVLKPWARGKILFAPNTTVVARVMERVKKMISVPKIPLSNFTDTDIFNRTVQMKFLEDIKEIKKNLRSIEDLPANEHVKRLTKDFLELTIDTVETQFNRIIQFSKQRSDSKVYNISSFLECFDGGELEGFATEEEAVVRGMELCNKNSLLALISFENKPDDTLTPLLQYKIRLNSDRYPHPRLTKTFPHQSGPHARPFPDLKLITFGFVYIQDAVERSILAEQLGSEEDLPGIILKQFPYPCHIEDWFMSSLRDTFPLFMVLSWTYTCSMIVKSIVYEKEERIKETMCILGLNNGIYWLSWFIDSFSIMLVTTSLLTAVLVLGGVLVFADASVLMLYLIVYTVATIAQSFLISVFFSQANVAAVCGGIIFFLTYLPYPLLGLWDDYNFVTDSLRSLVYHMCLIFSNVACGYGSRVFSIRELEGIGCNWDNVADKPSEGEPSLSSVMLVLLFDFHLYLVLTWYIEAVFPGKIGIPRPWYFPFTKHYWLDTTKSFSPPNSDEEKPKDGFEDEPSHLKKGVEIKNLRKVFTGENKVAVDNLTINFYQDQITAILGRNGAGKTTTVSLLTGLYPPTSGTAYINGLDIRNNMNVIRRSLGVCPQHNILFGLLTVEEHLWFFARLRGCSQGQVEAEMQQMITDLGLEGKRHERAEYLSGGMQRKLSIAVAFMGGSKTIFLDEPTAGVDPFSQAGIWKLLLQYKSGRTIVITTHILTEAEILSDRIAIFSNGKVLCCGTTSFLKARYGSEYVLTIEKSQLVSDSTVSALTDVIQTMMPEASYKEHFGYEIKYCLPKYNNTMNYGTLLTFIQENKEVLNIQSFGIAHTSMEDIFLHLIEENAALEELTQKLTYDKLTTREINLETEKKEQPICQRQTSMTMRTFCRQFWALHIKRVHHIRRSVISPISELILPVAFIWLSMWVTNNLPPIEQPPSEVISPFVESSQLITFFSLEPKAGNLSYKYANEIFSDINFGLECNRQGLRKENNECSSKFIPDFPLGVKHLEECSCNTGKLLCPTSHEETIPVLQISDSAIDSELCVANLTGKNLSHWLLQTWTNDPFKNNSFGGYSFGIPLPFKNIYNKESNNSRSNDNLKVWFNNKWHLAAPTYLNSINNVVLRATVPHNISKQYGIKLINHPMNFTESQYKAELAYQTSTALLHSVSIIFAMSFVSASFLMYLIEERVSKSKHLQFVSGVHWGVYWLETFTWDMDNGVYLVLSLGERLSAVNVSGLNLLGAVLTIGFFNLGTCYSISAFCCIFIMFSLNQEAYIVDGNWVCSLLLLILYGWASIPLMYPASYVFNLPSSAFVTISCLNLFVGIITTASVHVLKLFNDPDLILLESTLRDIFLMSPHFCMGEGFLKMAELHLIRPTLKAYDMDLVINLLHWQYLGKNMFSMFVSGILYFSAILLYEKFRFQQILSERKVSLKLAPIDEDDVMAETERILTGDTQDDVLVLKYLTKVYKYKNTEMPAVNQLCLGVRKGECFGLLGMNGAGKTTTFRMLTGDTSITFGDALVAGNSVRNNLKTVRSYIGYCPQFDALDSQLTPKEHLQLHGRLKGIPKIHLEECIEKALYSFDLKEFENIPSKHLSGGNKRKLSTAIALMGRPLLIFMDEPTCGMDPKAKRFMWLRIRQHVESGQSVVLTSHSMAECEALCSRLTIMVNGEFKCLGSIQHLKNKYGKGYKMLIHSNTNKQSQLRQLIKEKLPQASEECSQLFQIRYNLPLESSHLADTFNILEKARDQGLLNDYSLSQNSLEEVFLKFAKKQIHHEQPNKPYCTCFRTLTNICSRIDPRLSRKKAKEDEFINQVAA